MAMGTMIFLMLVAYLLGSIPSGLLIGKLFFKTDIRQFGSKNIGATNAYRILGLPAALGVFLCDAIKGALGVYIFAPNPTWMLVGGILAMIGHNWSVWLGFKGGRGVATGLGVLCCLVPWVSLICLGIWIVLVGITKYVSLGSVVAAFCVPFLMIAFSEPLAYVAFGTLAAVFVIVRHKENIRRLLAGQELKVVRIKKDDAK